MIQVKKSMIYRYWLSYKWVLVNYRLLFTVQ